MDINEDIEKMLKEDPIESNSKIQTYGKAKKSNILSKLASKKKLIIGIGVVVLIILIGFILISSTNECEVCNVCTQKISIETIKQQIITKGYAELNDGPNILRLSPYTG